ncbi:MAG: TetR/AcrR family transcriptional regulator [Acidimicrobiia bacterium]
MRALGPDDYFNAALDIAAEHGFDAVTIARLCERLGVTQGSFYHHFKNGRDFTTALFGYWEAEHGHRLVDRARAESDPRVRVALFKDLALHLPHGAERAIRAWSTNHPEARSAQANVDAARIQVVEDTLRELGMTRPAAATLARTAVSILVGMQQIEPEPNRTRLRQVFDELEAWILHRSSALA